MALVNFFHGLFAPAARSDIPKLTNYNDSIYVFYVPPIPPKGIVIFFHDIHWKEYEEPHVQAWMSSSEPSVCWPQHWLGVKYPEMAILSARYDAGIWKSNTTGHMDLHLLAENLKHDILQIYVKSCPVFLVGHGLGGLVIKKLIKNMQEECDLLSKITFSKESQRLDCFLKNLKGVFYYATPFLGSRVITSMKETPHSGEVLDALQVLGTNACRLNAWFEKWRKGNHCRTTAIFPTFPTKVALWYGNWSIHVVEEASARYDVDVFYSSKSDHFNVCKPRDQKDSSFLMLTELLDSHMSSITSGPTSQVGENVDVECEEIVRNLLNELAKLQVGKGIWIQRDLVAKMGKYPKTLGSLRDSLNNAGFELTFEDSSFEYWEPGCDNGVSEYTPEDSP